MLLKRNACSLTAHKHSERRGGAGEFERKGSERDENKQEKTHSNRFTY